MTAAATAQWRENRPTAGLRALRLRELWEYRELILFLALRDFKAKYKQAVFGIGWAIVQPVAGVLVFTIVFRRFAGVPSEGMPYIVFALIGFVVWSYFAASLAAASASLVNNAALVTKVYFPRIAAPIASLLPGLVQIVLGLALVGCLMAVYEITPGIEALLFPVVVLGAVVGVLDAARWCLVDGPSPGADVLASAASALVLLALGFVYFQRTERQFAD